MSDMEDDLEFYAAFEDELYKETSSVESNDEIDSELEATLYQNVHFASSFVITPSKQEENDISGDPNLLESSADESEPNNIDEKQDISKYPEVEMVFSNEKNIPKSSKSKKDASNLSNLDQTTNGDEVDTEDGLKTNSGWELIEADLLPAISHGKGKKRTSYIRCFNCNEKGHRTFECTQPKKDKVCFLCGGVGHLKQECQNELCFNCHEPGHQFRQCRRPRCRQGDICRRCNAYGHFENFCPDKWRQYHFTVIPGAIVPTKYEHKPQDDKVFCYNCGAEGHLGHECLEDRPDGSFAGSYPFVVKYDNFTTTGSPWFHNTIKSQNHHHHEREHVHHQNEKRRKRGNMEDRREDHYPFESTEFKEMSEMVDGADCSFGHKQSKKRKKRKNKAKVEVELVEESNKMKRRRRLNKNKIDCNEDMAKNTFINMAPGRKHKRNNRKKKNKKRAIESNVDSQPAFTFEEQVPPTEAKTKLSKSQKKRLSQPKPHKRTEPGNLRKPKKHRNAAAIANPSRIVYFDFNGFV